MYTYATTSASRASGHGHAAMRPNNFCERNLITPVSLSASDIINSGANQTSASQAFFSESRSSQVSTFAISIAERPASATNVFERLYQGFGIRSEKIWNASRLFVTQPAMTPSMMAMSHFSSLVNGPMRASSARESSRAGAVSVISGLKNLKISHGTISKDRKPGRDEPVNQRIQVNSTWPIFQANSAMSGLAAIPVRKMAEAV